MKNILVVLVGVLMMGLSTHSFGQIDVKEKMVDNRSLKEIIFKDYLLEKYDSTNNCPRLSLECFINQKVLLNIDNTSELLYTNTDSDNLIPYTLQSNGKYFKVIGYEIKKCGKFSSYYNTYLKLLTSINDTVYSLYIKEHSENIFMPKYNFPFITVGFFEKQKSRCVNKLVTYQGEIYTCENVFVEENSKIISYTIKKDGVVKNSSQFYDVKPLKTLQFDTTISVKENSSITTKLSKGSSSIITINSSGTNIIILFSMSNHLCFDTDDIIVLKFTNGDKKEEYYRGKFNCKGYVYLTLDITIERYLNLIKYLSENRLETVFAVGTSSDYMILNPNNNFQELIKAHYNKLIK